MGGGANNIIGHYTLTCVSCGRSMTAAQVQGVAGSKEDFYAIIQSYNDHNCTVDQLIRQLHIMETDIWAKYQNDDVFQLMMRQAIVCDKTRKLALFFMGLNWIPPIHLTQCDIHRNLGVMLEEKKGSVNILRGFEMVGDRPIWVCLCLIFFSTQVMAQSLDTTSVKVRKYFI